MSRPKIDDVDARQGEKTKVVRRVLAISLAASVVALAVLLLIFM